MKVMIVNYDSVIPNVALHKIKMYHEEKGDDIIENFPLAAHTCDKVYVSCVFSENKDSCLSEWGEMHKANVGGSGVNLHKPLPLEIENMRPRINYGFTTRGCVRRCKFCVVPTKEGKIRVVEDDLRNIWDGVSNGIVLLDNNVFGKPEHFKKICRQANELGIKVDFNQGLDARLLTDDLVKHMKISMNTYNAHFAYDDVKYEKDVKKAIALLKKNGIKSVIWLVLVGFNSTPTEDMARVEYLRREGQRVYVMRYRGEGGVAKPNHPFYVSFAHWANWRPLFKTMTFLEYLEKKEAPSMVKRINDSGVTFT